jgi:c-di-GMP-binding flagellar brake protein YcgR
MTEAEAMAEEPLAARPNRRQLPRFPVDEDATLLLVNHGSKVSCRVLDLSRGGCRLFVPERFQGGIMIRVEVTFKVRGLAFRFSGVTQWTDGRHQVGIRFVDVIPRRREELIEALDELEQELAAKAAKQAGEAASAAADGEEEIEQRGNLQESIDLSIALPVDEPKEEVSDDSYKPEKEAAGRSPASSAPASFLEALFAKPFSSPRPASPPPPVQAVQARFSPPVPSVPEPPRASLKEPAPEPSPAMPRLYQPRPLEPEPVVQKPAAALPPSPSSAAAPAKGRDRRVQSRQAVDTTAFLYLVKIASRLSGRILDLSTSGCRIRTDERFPVGIYTRVEIEFHLEGLPFRLGGVVQAIHDRHHVGIRFLDMSARKLEQIEQLIEEIKEMHGETHPEKRWTEKPEEQ